jgi:hypothetical protein
MALRGWPFVSAGFVEIRVRRGSCMVASGVAENRAMTSRTGVAEFPPSTVRAPYSRWGTTLTVPSLTPSFYATRRTLALWCS